MSLASVEGPGSAHSVQPPPFGRWHKIGVEGKSGSPPSPQGGLHDDPGSFEPVLQLVSAKVRASVDPTPHCTVSVVDLLRHQDL